MENTLDFRALNGTKLEYCATENGSYAQIKGIATVPDVGGEPTTIDTTTLDNTKYETAIYGLRPAVKLAYEYNLEDPSANANFKLACDLEDSGLAYYWKLTYSNGIILKYRSKVYLDIKGGSSNELLKFTMYHSPISEIERTIPTGSV